MTRTLKKNVAGYVDSNGTFRPIRSPQYIGNREATPKDRRKYSKALGGDLGPEKKAKALFEKNEDPWDREAREEREEKERIEREIAGDIYGSKSERQSLMQFVRASGGIKRQFRFGGKKAFGKRSEYDKGEIDRLSFKETGRRGLTSERGGKTLDKMFQSAREAGYDVGSIDDLLAQVEDEAAGRGTTYATMGSLTYNPKKKNPDVDWGTRVCAECGRYVANKDVKKLGSVNVCSSCHKKLSARSAAKKQGSLFDEQGSLFNPAKKKTTLRKRGVAAVRAAKAAIDIFDNDHDHDVDAKDVKRLKAASKKNPKGRRWSNQGPYWTLLSSTGRGLIDIERKGKYYVVDGRRAGGDFSGHSKLSTAKRVAEHLVGPKKNPLITDFAQLMNGAVAAYQLNEMMNKKKPVRRKKTTAKRRRNPETQAQINARMAKLRAMRTNPGKAAVRPVLNPAKKTARKKVRILGQEVTVGTKRHAELVARKKHADDLAKYETGFSRKNPTKRVSRTANRRPLTADSYYLNPFMDGVYLSHGTTLGRKFATQAAARKFARENKIRLTNPGTLVNGVPTEPVENGIFSRYRAKRRAKREYGRELSYAAKIKRSRAKRKKAEALAWNPAKAVASKVQSPKPKAKANPVKKTAAPKKRNPPTTAHRRTFEMFNGRKATQAKALEISALAGRGVKMDQLGDLVEIHLDNGAVIKTNPAQFKLVARAGRLWIAGGKFHTGEMPTRKLNPIGKLHHVVYRTWKPHHGDPKGQHYIHEMGEGSGNKPTLAIDNQGYPVIRGGSYKIEARGIVD